MNDKKITVIIPVYKVEPYLRKCVDSVLVQTYTNLEVILVDDGSPDNCPAICDEYAARDNRVRVIHQQNAGVSAARNAGLDIATGDYIGFVDSDDWIEPDMYETLYGMIEEKNVEIAYVDYVREQGNSSTHVLNEGNTCVYSANEALSLMFTYQKIHGMVWLFIAKRSLFEQLGFDTDISVSEDFLFAVDLILRAESVAYRPYCCYHYYIHDGSAFHSYYVAPSFWTYIVAYDRIEKLLADKAPDLIDDFFVRCLDEDTMQAGGLCIKNQLIRPYYRIIRQHVTGHCTRKAMSKLSPKRKMAIYFMLMGLYPFKVATKLSMLLGIKKRDGNL